MMSDIFPSYMQTFIFADDLVKFHGLNFTSFAVFTPSKHISTGIDYRILALISAALIKTSLVILGGVLITKCLFPLSYTKFGSQTQTRPKQGGALIIGGALMTARLHIYLASTIPVSSQYLTGLYTNIFTHLPFGQVMCNFYLPSQHFTCPIRQLAIDAVLIC